MRFLSFLFLFLFFNISSAYTVILKSGKQVSGDYVAEDQSTLQLRDPSGIVLSFKKINLDLDAMRIANQEMVEVVEPNSAPHAESPRLIEPDLVKLARKVRSKRTGNSRIYTADSIRTAPEISYSESGVESSVERKREPVAGALDEREWRESTRKLKRAIETIQDQKLKAEEDCMEAREKQQKREMMPRKANELGEQKEPAACARIRELDKRLQQAQWEYDDFQERARKQGVPWSWIE